MNYKVHWKTNYKYIICMFIFSYSHFRFHYESTYTWFRKKEIISINHIIGAVYRSVSPGGLSKDVIILIDQDKI